MSNYAVGKEKRIGRGDSGLDNAKDWTVMIR